MSRLQDLVTQLEELKQKEIALKSEILSAVGNNSIVANSTSPVTHTITTNYEKPTHLSGNKKVQLPKFSRGGRRNANVANSILYDTIKGHFGKKEWFSLPDVRQHVNQTRPQQVIGLAATLVKQGKLYKKGIGKNATFHLTRGAKPQDKIATKTRYARKVGSTIGKYGVPGAVLKHLNANYTTNFTARSLSTELNVPLQRAYDATSVLARARKIIRHGNGEYYSRARFLPNVNKTPVEVNQQVSQPT